MNNRQILKPNYQPNFEASHVRESDSDWLQISRDEKNFGARDISFEKRSNPLPRSVSKD